MDKALQDKAWQSLPAEFQKEVKYLYEHYRTYQRTPDQAVKDILNIVFGIENLASTEERPTERKEPKPLFESQYNAGDIIRITGGFCAHKANIAVLVKQYDAPCEYNDFKKKWVIRIANRNEYQISEGDFEPYIEPETKEDMKEKDKTFDRILAMNTEAEKRQFAAQAMCAILSNINITDDIYALDQMFEHTVARKAIECADALIAELNKRKEEK